MKTSGFIISSFYIIPITMDVDMEILIKFKYALEHP